jgi:hypothetical protein
MAVIHEADPTDPISDMSIRCEIEVHASGIVTLMRSPSCTEEDAMDIFRAVSGVMCTCVT